MSKAVFFDRDGTLMEEVHYCNDPGNVRVFRGATEALRQLRQQGWKAILVTNQSGIARGKITMEQYELVHSEFLQQLENELDAAYFSADSPETPGRRRKPGPGMLEEAAAEWGLDLKACWMVGDKAVDVQAGRAAGCRTILVQTGYGAGQPACGADLVVPDVVAAVDFVLNAK